jgi:AraC-like DNA-binding protein
MAAALERVGDHRNNLTQLALDLGYSSHSHFTTAFRAYFALPPSTAAASERFLAVRKKLKARNSPMR